MGQVVPFPSLRREAEIRQQRPPETVFEADGWRILEVPAAGQFLALSGYCRRGVEVGRFDPEADGEDHHHGTEVAILTRCGADERLSRCTIGWLNADGPPNAILGAFVVAFGGRYHFWRDAVIEVAVIGSLRLVRLLDGSIAMARSPSLCGCSTRSRRCRSCGDEGLSSACRARSRPLCCAGPIRVTSSASCSPRPCPIDLVCRGAAPSTQPWSASARETRLRCRESLSRVGWPPILSMMRRQPIDPIFEAEAEPPVRLCDHPGCSAGGDFRAPKSRLELNSYYWFCIEHVRAYNTAWNYYAGMNEAEIEAEIRRATVWDRPSWRLGQLHAPGYGARVRDPFGFHNGAERKEHNGAHRTNGRHAGWAAHVASAREQALAVFDLEPPFTELRLKARYKVLVKEHHPDAHGGDKVFEEKLKIINQAYATLKASYFS